jgi:hypothetical protein
METIPHFVAKKGIAVAVSNFNWEESFFLLRQDFCATTSGNRAPRLWIGDDRKIA